MSFLTISKTALKKSFETKMGADIIVPDSKSDVANVINVYAYVNMGESYINKDKLTVSGNMCYNIIYNTDEEIPKVCSINYKTPFSHQIDIKNSDSISSHLVKAKVEKVDFSLLNSRKVGANVTVVFNVILNEETSHEISCESDECIPVKSENIKCFNNVICCKEDFETEYQSFLKDAKNLLNSFATISSKDIKVINNKVILKGSIKYGVIYENENCQVNFKEFFSDFTEVIDVNGINPQMIIDIDLMIKENDANLSYSEEENLWINTYLCAYINAYEECEYDICTDAYSPDYEINSQIKEISYQCLSERICDKITVSDYVDVSKNGITCVYDTSVAFKHAKQIVCDGKIISDGFAFVDILYISGEGKLCAVKKTIPYSYARDINSECDCLNVKSNIELESVSYNVNSNGEIEVKIAMNICIDVFYEKEMKIITSIDVDKSKCIDKTNMSGITIYFVQKGDSLWEIAKKYHTTTEKIAKINSLDVNNNIIPGQRILIPKK